MPDKVDLDLVPMDDLVAAVMRRAEHSVIAFQLPGPQKTVGVMSNGDVHVCMGIAVDLLLRIGLQHVANTTIKRQPPLD